MIVFGCFLPAKYLPFHLLAWPIVYLHWQFNNNRCILTQLEIEISNKEAPDVRDHVDDYYFMKIIILEFGLELSNKQLDWCTYMAFTIPVL